MEIMDGNTFPKSKYNKSHSYDSIDIIGSDDNALYNIKIEDSELIISASMNCKHNGKVLSERLAVKPIVSNKISVMRLER